MQLLYGSSCLSFQGVDGYPKISFMGMWVDFPVRDKLQLWLMATVPIRVCLLFTRFTLLRDLRTWSQAKVEAARYFRHVHKTPLLDSFPNTPVLLDPPATTKEAQSDPFVPINKSQPSLTVPVPTAASPALKFFSRLSSR